MTLDPLIFPPTLRQPAPHQVEGYELFRDAEVAAYFMEARTRKTLIVVKQAAYQYRKEAINGLLVILWPNGGQFEWAANFPLDWPLDLPHNFVAWRSGGMGKAETSPGRPTRFTHAMLSEALADNGFVAVAMNCEALLTDLGWRFVSRFIQTRRLMVCADESSFMKSPSSARTKRMLSLGGHPNAVFRRILDGTPAAEGSLDLWAPCAFLDWRLLGHKSYFTFRNRYVVMTTGYAPGGRQFATPMKSAEGGTVYQNLDELKDKLSKFSYRVLRSEVSRAPPPDYSEVYFELTPRQRRVYDRLDQEYEAEKRAGTFPVALAITRYLRLQMISRNYMPSEEVGLPCECDGNPECPICEGLGVKVVRTELERIDEKNPALEAFVARVGLVRGPTVCWVRFKQDARDLEAALRDRGHRTARYDGDVRPTERRAAYDAFRAGKLDAIVCTSASGISRGHDLSAAAACGYYSNSYVARDRQQSQDRTESLDRTVPTDVFDLVGVDTRDLPIITALREKKSVERVIMGDR